VVGSGERNLPAERLFTSVERWGWQYREPDTAAEAFPDDPPLTPMPSPSWARQAAPRMETALRQRSWHYLSAAGMLASTGLLGGLVNPVAASVPVIAGSAFTWLATGRLWRLRRRAEAAHQAWLRQCEAAQQQQREQLANWTRKKHEHDWRERARLATTPQWGPICPSRSMERVDIFGGVATGWRALLAATGASLLGSGAQVNILDLSQEEVAGDLVQLATRQRCRTDLLTLPDQMADVDAFAGLTAHEVSAILVETLHAMDKESTHEARSMDAEVLRKVCEVLHERLTIARVCAALRVLLRQEPPPTGAGTTLTAQEYEQVSEEFGEAARRTIEPRVVTLAARLHHLAPLGSRLEGARSLAAGQAQLRVVSITERGPDLTTELLTHLLMQLVIHDIRREPDSSAGQRVLLIAGADELRRAHLERLDRLGRQRGIRLVYLFRHLRDDAVKLLGSGEAVFFMRLGNKDEATQAAEFIGRAHKFTVSQFTTSVQENTSITATYSISDSIGDQTSDTTGTQRSRSSGKTLRDPLGGGNLAEGNSLNEGLSTGDQDSTTTGVTTSRTWGVSHAEGGGTTTGETATWQRVHEFTVEPTNLQELYPTAFLFVDKHDPRGPRFGDCNPAILTLPNVQDEPFLSSSHGREPE